MATIFWISATLVLFAYAGYPMLLMALTRVRSRMVHRRRITPRVTFVITAHNEERRLPEKLQNTLAQN